jgi:glutathione S-transferase
MKLYYAPGACSLADHIALLEADMKVDLVKVNLKTHTLDDGRSYRDINPKGYVPAIELDDGELLTENVAILSYIADRYPALMAPGPLGRYRLLEMLSYLATEVHKTFHPLFDPGASAAEKKAAGEAVVAADGAGGAAARGADRLRPDRLRHGHPKPSPRAVCAHPPRSFTVSPRFSGQARR